MKTILLLSSVLLFSCVEGSAATPVPSEADQCAVAIWRYKYASEIRVTGSCPAGETRTLSLHVADGGTELSVAVARFACPEIILVNLVNALEPDLQVGAAVLRDDGARVACDAAP